MTLSFSFRDELYCITPERVLYMEADDHYTEICYSNGIKFTVPIGLSRMEQTLAAAEPALDYLVRLGRRYIINIRAVFYVSTVKQVVMLDDQHGERHSLHVSKQVLRQLVDSMAQKEQNP